MNARARRGGYSVRPGGTLAALLLAVLALSAASCDKGDSGGGGSGGTASTTGSTTTAPAGKRVRIGYTLHVVNDFSQVIRKGAEDAGNALGVEVEVQGPA